MKYIFIIIIIFTLFIIITFKQNRYVLVSSFDKLQYYKFDKDLSYSNTIDVSYNIFKHRLKNLEINFAKYESANIIFFNLLSDYISLKQNLLLNNKIKFCYSLTTIDLLASKSMLYSVLRKKLSKSQLHSITPITFIIQSKSEKKDFITNHLANNTLYILKKNIQRQKGCLISKDHTIIKQEIKDDYVVIQELLQDPFLINNKKINIRQYLLIDIQNNVNFYIYNDGFMYYTKTDYEKGSDDYDSNLTTGYIDRNIYKDNPLTYQDFLKSLGEKERAVIVDNMYYLFTLLKSAYKSIIEKHDNNRIRNFVILGCDIAVDEKLDCKIMEINKGPDLNFKDDIDKLVKQKLIHNTFEGIFKTNEFKNFIHIK
jgi:hypothetical protein